MAYDDNYFSWQQDMGFFGGIVNSPIFTPYLHEDDAVVDLGCGGGYLLHNLQCREKVGVEVNPSAREQAQSLGISAHATIEELPDQFANLVISNHALEHFESPFHALVELKPKIKKGGLLVFVVPHEGPKNAWCPDDINQHLYTWNPMTLGNLFTKAGYRVRSVDTLRIRWPRRYQAIYRFFGARVFNLACRIEAYRVGSYQVRIVAEKE